MAPAKNGFTGHSRFLQSFKIIELPSQNLFLQIGHAMCQHTLNRFAKPAGSKQAFILLDKCRTTELAT
eukprot:scaffold133070_cov36-Prasinocladus_malaysianus.AAC.2